ncbi:sensor histidine kinase [Pontibacillus yanchengensis]|uniref:histidine kinase n=1 Tax=Pontibacillus yanchengensis Y32 TaxID=1385514 RepID=A0A0A2TFV2_9BACI|nr:HAMP domain-containing sensor histidine kinase [Pontibacillus yanchengensis]KGP73313.1 histidine kinase [Pontibacillus yanchengensis Y32]
MKKQHSSSSLLRKYVFIIFGAIILVPMSLPLLSLVFYSVTDWMYGAPTMYQGSELEETIHTNAKQLETASPSEVNRTINEIKEEYPDASLFWVDKEGELQYQVGNPKGARKTWNTSEAIQFMKESINENPFTVVAFIGEDRSNGFLVFQISRTFLDNKMNRYIMEYGPYFYFAGTAVIYIAFIVVSYLFFHRIRKRLIGLQEAMIPSDTNTIPKPIPIDKRDEIGLLKETFNNMIYTLEESRTKEKQEEKLRREITANLSHDLRTPLTTLRGQIYTLKEEVTSEQGKEALSLADEKISYLGELIDNLLAYSLLTSHRYPYNPEQTDLVRLVRTSLAEWYPSFEGEDFEVNVAFPKQPLNVFLDPKWMQRVLDNVFQNVIRHAKQGKYINITIIEKNNDITLEVNDKGPGFEQQPSSSKGTGIGLRIISLMVKEMGGEWDIQSSTEGNSYYFHFHAKK